MKLVVLFFVVVHLKHIRAHKWFTPCTTNANCSSLINATCHEGYCNCNNSFLVCREKLGNRCKNPQDCNIENSHCANAKCTCLNQFTPSSDFQRCLKLVRNVVTDSCEENFQCPDLQTNICRHGKCVCTNGTSKINGICVRFTEELGLKCGEVCAKINSSSCVNLRCKCKETFVAINHKCLKVAADLGDGCEDDIQCAAVSMGARCLERKCVRDVYVTEMCVKNEDCGELGESSNHLVCTDGLCRCKWSHKEDGSCMEIASKASQFRKYTSCAWLVIIMNFMYLT